MGFPMIFFSSLNVSVSTLSVLRNQDPAVAISDGFKATKTSEGKSNGFGKDWGVPPKGGRETEEASCQSLSLWGPIKSNVFRRDAEKRAPKKGQRREGKRDARAEVEWWCFGSSRKLLQNRKAFESAIGPFS